MPRSRWTKHRIARACFLAGRGLEADEIARDDMVQSHGKAVRDACRFYGIAFSERLPGNLVVDVPTPLLANLEEQAKRRRQTPEALASAALRILAGDPVLLANVMDDEV